MAGTTIVVGHNKVHILGGKMNKINEALVKSYLRAIAGSLGTVVGIDNLFDANIDIKAYVVTLLGAIIPVTIRYFDSNDNAFGKKKTLDELTKVIKNVEVPVKKKAPAKKKPYKAPETPKK